MTLANLSRFGSALFAAPVVPDSLLLLGCGLYIGDLDALICCNLDFQLLDYDPLSSNFWLAITIFQALHSCVAWGVRTPRSERPLLPEPLLVLKYILLAIVFLYYLAFYPCSYGKAVSQCSPTESCSSPGIADQFPRMELGVPVTLLQYQSIICNPRIYLDIRRYETLI
jgi:hypothetical protein